MKLRERVLIESTCYGCEVNHRLEVDSLEFDVFMRLKGKAPSSNPEDQELLYGFRKKSYLCFSCKDELLSEIPL
mgnify:FL=1